jgi:hypothetical protein
MLQSYLDYLFTCPNNKEVYTFATQDDADNFGQSLRQILKDELQCDYFDIGEFIDIKISNLTVRIKAVTESLEPFILS